MKKKVDLILAILFMILTAVFTYLVQVVDVAILEPVNMPVGFSHINDWFRHLTGNLVAVKEPCFTISETCGYAALGVVAFFAFVGLIQWIKRKKFRAVDNEILMLGALYIITLIVYAVFTRVTVDYRPVFAPGETAPESAFPSSHTVLAIVVFGSAAMLVPKYIHQTAWRFLLSALLWIVAALSVASRLNSGAHWFTDVVGAVLYSTTLLSIYCVLKDYIHLGGQHA